MPSKTEEYLALAQRTANGLTRYWESWTDYLTTACCPFQCWQYALLKHGNVQQAVLVLNLPACAPCEPFLQVTSSRNSASSFTSIVLYRSGE